MVQKKKMDYTIQLTQSIERKLDRVDMRYETCRYSQGVLQSQADRAFNIPLKYLKQNFIPKSQMGLSQPPQHPLGTPVQKDSKNHPKMGAAFSQQLLTPQVNKSGAQFQNNQRKLNIQQIKDSSISQLKQLVLLKEISKISEKSQQIIVKATDDMMNEVDKLQRELQYLKDDLKKKDETIELLQRSHQDAIEKNKVIQLSTVDQNREFDNLRKNLFDVQLFIPEYQILKQKYEKISATRIIDDIAKFQKEIREQQIEIAEQE